jgi:hypothetical protein
MGVIFSMLRKVGSVHKVSVRIHLNSLSELGRDCVLSYLREKGGLD